MKIEELMPQIRAKAKVRCKSWRKGDYMQFVENNVASDWHEFGSDEPYTGFIAQVDANWWEVSLNGASMMRDDWELYDEPTQSV